MKEKQEGLKAFMRLYPQGVTVVTTKINGRPFGMTVSSFTSVSMDPPLVMMAIDRSSNTHKAFIDSQIFVVHLLSSDQAQLSEIFAGRAKTENRFEGIGYDEGVGGVPILRDAPAHLICQKYKVYEAGDHDLILCEILEVVVKRRDFKPLIYRDRAYTTVAG
ncbi:MAG: flavin reductase family protein [Nitrososphaerota archaeon]|nr:flavin reductase family protein [Candidatus Calditenuaceae archaeon]MDW8073734.1 flavin reductase family protein [Nitrososphaerota archaeon]